MKSRGVKKRKGARATKIRSNFKMEGSITRQLQVQLQHVSLLALDCHQSSFQSHQVTSVIADDAPGDVHEKDFILSQDFFCTPDYITPDNSNLMMSFGCNKDEISCPPSPEKQTTVKRQRKDLSSIYPLSPTLSGHQQIAELARDASGAEESEKSKVNSRQKIQNYVSPSVVALRCRVMPPPCIRNPYQMDSTKPDIDPFGSQRAKCAGFLSTFVGGDGLSRYYADFHEIQQIGVGNFSRVFKVLNRIDGCYYAVKRSTRQLHQETERRKALLEVQALAALGSHENIVGYYSSWFENEQLHIQMELCDHSLTSDVISRSFSEGEVLKIMHQVSKALQFMHKKGVAHLDIKPDNIYVKNGIYKLGDFGCATRLDQSLPIEEGDARYMPLEILNENYNHLDKVDIFSLGVAIYELIRRSPLQESERRSFILKEGKLPLLPGHSLQFQSLLKMMVDPNPARRPSAKELVENQVFGRIQQLSRS